VKRDDAEAATWYRKAAEQGHAGAQCSLGYIYEKGGLIAEAATWYRKAAEQGNPEAQHNLGALYAQGRGLKQDYAEAVKWFRKAADQGMPGSQLALGLLSELGIGMPRNYSQAITWYQRAAESGQPDAQYRLGNMHLLGRGVPADPAEAAKWFGMAAEKNVADAEYALGQLYDGGVGVAQDRIKAQELFRRAADHGSAGAKERIQQAKNPEAASKSEMPERRASEELNELIGMQGVKEEVRGLQALLWMQRQRTQQGLKTIDPTLHLVFTGGPGTGKTTVARIVAKIYREAGILPKGHLVEVDRAALVGTYLGQTAPKTTDVVESAMGGVLFIDEAYSLVARNAGFQDAYGQEVISTLLKLMEDKRGRFALIVAGYPEEMKAFLESNPGLRSRFPKQIHFPDYSARELGEIFRLLLKKSDLEGTAAALAKVDKYLESILKVADKRTFGNAREVRTIVECAQVNQAERLHESRADLTASRMRTLTPEDFEFLATRLREESPRAATPRNATR
jgi:TPR repeat protein